MASAITTTNIDVTFPVPGKDNDTQGFRDNFSQIKIGLDTAKSEISDIQAGQAGLVNTLNEVALIGAGYTATVVAYAVPLAVNTITNFPNSIKTSIDAINATLTTILSYIGTDTSDVATIKNQITAINTTLNTLVAYTGSDASIVISLQSQIANNSDTIVSMSSTVTSLSNTVTSLLTTGTTAYANIAILQGQVSTLQTTATDHQSRLLPISALQTTATDHQSRIGTLETTKIYFTVGQPVNSKGASGDKRGMIYAALGGTYFYICFADYTTGAADIWMRVATGDTSW